MESQEQSERQICRAIVLGREGTEVLLKIPGPGFAFPAVEVPRWERWAENVTAALKRDCGCDAVCLARTMKSWSACVREDAKTKRYGNQSAP